MAEAIRVSTVVRKVTRRNSSMNGNPTKVLHTDNGEFTTAMDAMCAYGVSDHWSCQPVRLTLNEHGRVIAVEEQSDAAPQG